MNTLPTRHASGAKPAWLCLAAVPAQAQASLHASGAGVFGLLLVAVAALAALPVLAALTAAPGQRLRDWMASWVLWLCLNLASFLWPNENPALADRLFIERFQRLFVGCLLVLVVVRLWQWLRRRAEARQPAARSTDAPADQR